MKSLASPGKRKATLSLETALEQVSDSLVDDDTPLLPEDGWITPESRRLGKRARTNGDVVDKDIRATQMAAGQSAARDEAAKPTPPVQGSDVPLPDMFFVARKSAVSNADGRLKLTPSKRPSIKTLIESPLMPLRTAKEDIDADRLATKLLQAACKTKHSAPTSGLAAPPINATDLVTSESSTSETIEPPKASQTTAFAAFKMPESSKPADVPSNAGDASWSVPSTPSKPSTALDASTAMQPTALPPIVSAPKPEVAPATTATTATAAAVSAPATDSAKPTAAPTSLFGSVSPATSTDKPSAAPLFGFQPVVTPVATSQPPMSMFGSKDTTTAVDASTKHDAVPATTAPAPLFGAQQPGQAAAPGFNFNAGGSDMTAAPSAPGPFTFGSGAGPGASGGTGDHTVGRRMILPKSRTRKTLSRH
eukprot:jgi/Hompol1/4486/HPOL_000548-RA